MRTLPFFILALCLAAALPGAMSAQAWPVPRLSGPIEIDGRVDEAAWEAVDPLPVSQHAPSFGEPPTERTEFRVAYDDDHVYLSCRAYDADPSGIQAPSLRRDVSSLSNDWCTLQLDSFNDNETTLGFGTTPAGIRTDVVFANDGTAPPNFTWNTFWDAAATRDERGWYAEVRVPLSSLRFQQRPGTDEVVMGLSVWRLIARKNEMHTWPEISPRWGGFSMVKASQFQDAVFRGIERTDPVYVTPYALGGAGRSHALDDAGTGYRPETETVGDVGLDIKYALASNLTLDVTVNTDFAQVEADDQQVNLTRFSLFFPEKRLFFQERASIFEFSLGGQERLFHSRSIGIVAGERVPIHGGARVVGRVGGWDVGFLDMQTAATDLAPSENMGVLRLRRRVLNENSYIGGIVTSRFAEAGRGGNLVSGLDAVIRAVGQDYLTINIARSWDDPPADGTGGVPGPDPDAGPDAGERVLARVAWERRVTDGLTYGIDATRAGAAFDPGLGFLRRRDYTSAAGRIGYGWRPGEASPVLTHGPTVEAAAFTRNSDGVVETVTLEPSWNLALKAGHTFNAGITATHEDLDAGFALPDGAHVPAGEHRFVTAGLRYSPPNGSLLRAGARLEAGGFYDGRAITAAVTPTWNASRHLELGGAYQLNAVRLPERDQGFTAHIARLRTQVMFSTTVSAAAFVQYSSAADRFSANVRLRYNPSEGHDLYIVWNEGLLTDRHALDPAPPLSERRTVLLKYSRTFTFGL